MVAVPAPVRELFKLFPLAVLPPEPLPARSPSRPLPRARLYVFSRSERAARAGRPSFNPACLSWQTYLRIAGLPVDLVPSNNHASPSGSLPFLLPPTPSNPSSTTAAPLVGDKIGRYASGDAWSPPPAAHREVEALLTHDIRPAWLHVLYLLPSNAPLLRSLYATLPAVVPELRALRRAADEEIRRTTTTRDLLGDADAALRALAEMLGDKDWFFGGDAPSLLDAKVFAYTYLILDDEMGWVHNPLADRLVRYGNLVEHRRRLYERCWGPS